MPQRSGAGSTRSDCRNMAKCGGFSLYYCNYYCRPENRRRHVDCEFLTSHTAQEAGRADESKDEQPRPINTNEATEQETIT